jgi:hypothetical protein
MALLPLSNDALREVVLDGVFAPQRQERIDVLLPEPSS